MPTPELKPCPFCNKWSARLCENPSAHKYNRGWFIAHGGKGCVLSGVQSRGYATPDQAAAAWNRREPATPQPKQRRDRRKCVHFRLPTYEIAYAWCAKYGPHYECLGAHGCPNYREGGRP